MLQKWSDTKKFIDELASNLDKNLLRNKVIEELATLKDVHEGYQRYIKNAEPLSNDINKINSQIEANKVRYQLFLYNKSN